MTIPAHNPIPLGLRQRARVSLLLTAIVIAFDLVGFRSNWLLPAARFCGTILADGGWTTESPAHIRTALAPGEHRVCIRELIQPYSRFSGSTTVSMSVQAADGSMRLFDVQFFIARQLGRKQHNDTPGDWIFLNETRYNSLGWRISDSTQNVASWSSRFYTLPIRRSIWRMTQQNLGNSEQGYALSLQRRLGVFIAVNGALLISIILAIYTLLELLGLHHLLTSGRLRGLSRERIRHKLQTFRFNRVWLARSLLIVAMLAASMLLLVSRYSSHSILRPFWCKTYAGSWRICLHEIHRLPSKDLRMIVMQVSIQRPDHSELHALMQFFTALPKDQIGFADRPGSWHFQDRYEYDRNGWLIAHEPRPLSSIVDPLVPSKVQIALWNDVVYLIQDQYKARRLSLQSKLVEVSSSYLFMMLTVMLATWTSLNYLEIWILNQEFRAAASSLRPSSEKISTS